MDCYSNENNKYDTWLKAQPVSHKLYINMRNWYQIYTIDYTNDAAI